MIQVERLHKTYRTADGKVHQVLSDIDLTVRQGDFVMIIGESGCGKSTLLNIIAGFIPATSGMVRVNGRPVTGPDPAVSFLFQQPSLLPWLNVEENIAFGCKLRKDLDNLDYRVKQFIEIVGLSGFEKNRPLELSVGMAYRVSLARALIGHPDVFLLDEPFSALDTITRTRLQEELINIWLSEKFTAVFVTHDIDEAILLGQKVVLLGDRPSRIKDIIAIDMTYPRQLTDETFFHKKTDILFKFKKLLMPTP
ncbi:MAG: ABC transporter ATP-binding protein [Thermodesulfobacteriota bacterium]